MKFAEVFVMKVLDQTRVMVLVKAGITCAPKSMKMAIKGSILLVMELST